VRRQGGTKVRSVDLTSRLDVVAPKGREWGSIGSRWRRLQRKCWQPVSQEPMTVSSLRWPSTPTEAKGWKLGRITRKGVLPRNEAGPGLPATVVPSLWTLRRRRPFASVAVAARPPDLAGATVQLQQSSCSSQV
jgi:hypothetical protein